MFERICSYQRFILCVSCLFTTLVENGPRQIFAEESTENVKRKVFEYTGGFGKTWFVHEGGKKWVIYRGDGKTYLNVEESRTNEYINLRGPYTKLMYRLSTDKFQLRRSEDQPWGRGIRGKWVTEKNLPESICNAPKGYQIRLVYFVPRDREPVPNYKLKIQMVMSIVSDLLHNDLRSKGYRPKRLKFETRDGEIAVHILRAKEKASFYNAGSEISPDPQMARIESEIVKTFADPKRHLTVVFAETYEEGPAKAAWFGHIAKGGERRPEGGLAVYSTWLLKDAFTSTNLATQKKFFFDQTRIPGRKAFGSRLPNSPRYEFVEDAFGAVIHELGHALGVPHDYRNASRNIMGNGFREIRWNLDPRSPRNRRVGFSVDNARMLMTSRYLAPDLTLNDYDPPKVEFKLVRNGRVLAAQVQAEDESGLRALLFYDRTKKTTSLVGGRQLRGERQEFLHRLPADLLTIGRAPKVEIFVADNGGNFTRITKTLVEE